MALGPPNRPVDLGAIQAALGAPHVIDLRADGWTLMHPLSCRPYLFDCEVNLAADDQLREPPGDQGRFEVAFDGDGTLLLGRPVAGDLRDPIDVAAMAAEIAALRASLDSHHRYIDGLNGGQGCRLCPIEGR